MFSDKELAKNPLYAKSWKSIQKYAASQPVFGPFDHDLITLLREPQVFAPDSLRGQLEYLQKYWDTFLGEWLKRILAGMDTISEEEKAAWHGFGGGDLPDMQPYSFENLMNEYERFSADSEWMPKVILIAKTVLVWLDQLTKQYGYPITRLDQIPDAELDKLRDEGFTGLWLIGLWERSKASKRIKQICGNPEAAASAPHLGEMQALMKGFGLDETASKETQAVELAKRTGCVVVLKGRFTIVTEPNGRLTLNMSGGPALSTAGSGDVLTGVIGALLAQGMAAANAARLGVFLHGMAGDLWKGAQRAMSADDLVEMISEAWKEISVLS